MEQVTKLLEQLAQKLGTMDTLLDVASCIVDGNCNNTIYGNPNFVQPGILCFAGNFECIMNEIIKVKLFEVIE